VAYFERGGILQLTDTSAAEASVQGFRTIDGLLTVAEQLGVDVDGAPGHAAAACELVLEALVARRKISRSESGEYGRAVPEQRRRPNQDLFGVGMSA
jgi:magnesium chelatase subunit I